MNTLNLSDLAKTFADLEARESDADDPLDDDERAELADLRSLARDLGIDDADDMKRYARDESLLIEEGRSFEEYAEQLADDIGAIDRDAKWPVNCIDWEKAARELAYDYSTVTYGGTNYLIRSV
jgi:hypothetical protein